MTSENSVHKLVKKVRFQADCIYGPSLKPVLCVTAPDGEEIVIVGRKFWRQSTSGWTDIQDGVGP